MPKRSLLIVFALAAACGSDETRELDQPSLAECTQYRDRVVGLRLASVTDHRAEHQANLEAALGHFVDGCVREMPRGEVLCGRTAPDLESLAACVGR